MSRSPRYFLGVFRLTLTCSLLLCLAGVGSLVERSSRDAYATPTQPNILIIVTDDQRMHTVGSWMKKTACWFRYGWNPTPTDPDHYCTAAIPQPGGKTFQWAFVTTPNCCPSRASILTGRYAHNHDVRENGFPSSGDGVSNLNQDTTVEHHLHGTYWTGIYGKFMNDWVKQSLTDPSNPNLGNPKYFDRWGIFDKGYVSNGVAPGCGAPDTSDTEVCINEQGTYKDLVEYPTNYATTYVADKAVEFIQNAPTDKPWLLYVAPTAPHPPATPEAQYASVTPPPFDPNPANDPYIPPYPARPDRGIYPTDRSGKPAYIQQKDPNAFVPGLPNNTWPNELDCTGVTDSGATGYKACIAKFRANQYRTLNSVDDMVDRIFNAMGSQANNTLAIFVSDNGFFWGEFWLSGKWEPYTDATRVPLLMRWPSMLQTNTVDTRLVANIDIAPTVMAATGVPLPPGSPVMDGRNLLDPTARTKLLLERLVATGGSQAQARVWGALRTAPSGTPQYFHVTRFSGGDIDPTPPPPNPAPAPPTPLPSDWMPTFHEHYDLTTSPYLLTNAYSAPGEAIPDQGLPPPDTAPSASEFAQGIANYLNCSGPESPILSATQLPQTSTPGCP